MKNIKLAIRQVNSSAQKITCAKIISSTPPWTTLGVSYESTLATLQDSIYEIYAAYVEEEIVGCIVIQPKGAFSTYVKSLVIKKEWRGKHLGKALLEFVEQKVFSKSPNVFLCVSSFNKRAQKFYLNLGYQAIGEIENYVVNGHSELLMRKTIGPMIRDEV